MGDIWPPKIDHSYYPARWQSSRDGHGVLCIVVHATVGTDSRAYLQRGGERRDGSDRKVSAHVLISKTGVIYRMVDDGREANHAGFSTLSLGGRVYSPAGPSVNQISLGVELENLQNGRDPYTDDQLLALGWQIGEWRRKYGLLPIYRHADIDPTRRSDPQQLRVEAIEQCAKRATERSGGGPPAQVARVLPKAGARVRAAPSTTSQTLALLDQDTPVRVVGQADGPPPLGQADRRWAAVVLPDGRRGYVWARLLGGAANA